MNMDIELPPELQAELSGQIGDLPQLLFQAAKKVSR
jgi:hypothetical protein